MISRGQSQAVLTECRLLIHSLEVRCLGSNPPKLVFESPRCRALTPSTPATRASRSPFLDLIGLGNSACSSRFNSILGGRSSCATQATAHHPMIAQHRLLTGEAGAKSCTSLATRCIPSGEHHLTSTLQEARYSSGESSQSPVSIAILAGDPSLASS